MDLFDILKIVQLAFSAISASFVVGMCISKIVNWLKVRRLDAQERKTKLIEQKEKELFLELTKKYGTKTLEDLKEVKKDEK